MPVLGVHLTGVDAKKNGNVAGDINISINPAIKSINKAEIKPLGKDALSAEFDYDCRYTSSKKEIGNITITGIVIFTTDDNKKVLESWKSKKVESSVAVMVLNSIIRKCLTRCMYLSEELQLPAPMQMPKIKAADAKIKK